ncbi:MAG TPA: hypothetical protein DEO60_06510 [Bacteroidales bacterium]|nr:hypothetical protein [Bacteroidales bacterium]
MQKIGYILLIISSLLAGCSATRKAASNDSGNISGNTLESVFRNNLSNNDFYIQKAEINFFQDNISVRVVADMKFKRPDSVMITVRSRTGIEAGRAFITKDTLIIKDRFNKKLLIGKPEVLAKKYGIDPSFLFTVIGDIVVEEKDRDLFLECSKGEYRREFYVHGKKVQYIIDCQRKKLKQAYFEGEINSGNVTISLKEFDNEGKTVFPGLIEINDDLKSVGIIIEIRKIESPWNGRLGSVSGQGYKVVKIR